MTGAALILAGIVAGALSGLVGVGGGVILVPILVLIFGFAQKEAQGTTLAMLALPVGILAALTYYKAGYINFKAVGWIAAGFLLGSFAGSHMAVQVSEHAVSKLFGGILLIIAIKFLFFTK
jgi:uncharacterized membrane protein YfcA